MSCQVKHPRYGQCVLEMGHEGSHKPPPRESHHCHARGCKVETKPEMLMCYRHWKMVPALFQKAVWKHYRHGQCVDKNPSKEWIKAADDAIEAVATKEGK